MNGFNQDQSGAPPVDGKPFPIPVVHGSEFAVIVEKIVWIKQVVV